MHAHLDTPLHIYIPVCLWYETFWFLTVAGTSADALHLCGAILLMQHSMRSIVMNCYMQDTRKTFEKVSFMRIISIFFGFISYLKQHALRKML